MTKIVTVRVTVGSSSAPTFRLDTLRAGEAAPGASTTVRLRDRDAVSSAPDPLGRRSQVREPRADGNGIIRYVDVTYSTVP